MDSFDDRYLGSKTSDPTVDNDGNALVTGALYYNSSTQTMKVYDGANWIAATAAGTTAMLVYKYVATAGQTTFTGAATVGGTLSYTSGNIIVFLNGASLDSTDYTATNGTSVVLNTGAALSDEIVIIAFKSFTVADTYTQAQVDALLAGKIGTGSGTVSQSNLASGVAGNGPAFHYWQTTQQTGVSANTTVKVTLTASVFDTTGGMFASSRFTPTVAGYYQLNFGVQIPYANTNAAINASISKNGIVIISGSQSVGGNSLYPDSSGAGLVYLNGSTDYVELFVYGSQAGTTYNIQPGQERTFFSGFLARAA